MSEDVIERLTEAANAARLAEDAYRREAAVRIDALARERTFAFRRLNLVRRLFTAVEGQEEPEGRAAAARAALRAAIGWAEEDERRRVILDRFQPILDRIAGVPAEDETLAEAPLPDLIRAFESWFEQETGNPFYALFDVYVPETPVVDF